MPLRTSCTRSTWPGKVMWETALKLWPTSWCWISRAVACALGFSLPCALDFFFGLCTWSMATSFVSQDPLDVFQAAIARVPTPAPYPTRPHPMLPYLTPPHPTSPHRSKRASEWGQKQWVRKWVKSPGASEGHAAMPYWIYHLIAFRSETFIYLVTWDAYPAW